VLGVDQLSSEDEDEPKVVNAVTLQVTPNEGMMLALGQDVGKVSLLLRNEIDASILEKEEVTINDLLDIKPDPVKKVKVIYRAVRKSKKPSKPTVEIIRGLDIEKQTVKEE